MTPPNRNTAWAQTIFDELRRHGVCDVVVSPGSRSAPLALAAAAHDGLRDWSVLDERSAGFFALGLARAADRPAALVCTSGTASANYLPAVIEAHYSRVPLILLTADRPPELRSVGAPQTIVQPGLYGAYTVFDSDLPIATIREADFAQLRRTLAMAARKAQGPPAGPAHLNVGFREPLHPIEVREDQEALRSHSASSVARPVAAQQRSVAELALAPEQVATLADRLSDVEKGWIVAGPLTATASAAAAIERLANALGWPLLAEPLSRLRSSSKPSSVLLDASDALLRCRRFSDRNAPQLVLRFGAAPTSNALNQWLAAHPEIEQLVVSPWGWNDPSGVAREVLAAEPLRLARDLLERIAPSHKRNAFTDTWCQADRKLRALIDEELDSRSVLSEAEVARTALRLAAPRGRVYLGNSLPVRLADLYSGSDQRELQYFANRGANGIDGTLASALGTAAASETRSCVALIGDLSLLHDWSSVALAREPEINASIVVIDNGGGRIFESLPVAKHSERRVFERHFLTPQAVDLPSALRGFGLDCALVETRQTLETALATSIATPGVQFICARVPGSAHAEEQAKLIESIRSLLEVEA